MELVFLNGFLWHTFKIHWFLITFYGTLTPEYCLRDGTRSGSGTLKVICIQFLDCRQYESKGKFIRKEGDVVSVLNSYSFIYSFSYLDRTTSEGFSFEGLIKEIHFKERWRWEEKR